MLARLGGSRIFSAPTILAVIVFLWFSRFCGNIQMMHCQEVESLRGSDQWVWTLSSSRFRIKSSEWVAFCKGSSPSFLVRSGICRGILLNVCVFPLILHNSSSWTHLQNLSLVPVPNSGRNSHPFWALWFCAKWFLIAMNVIESTWIAWAIAIPEVGYSLILRNSSNFQMHLSKLDTISNTSSRPISSPLSCITNLIDSTYTA